MLKFRKIKGNFIHPTAVINWKSLIIGKGNTIGPYVVIGNQAQWKNKKNIGKIIIGDHNVFNEFTNIHLPTILKKKTYIGDNNYIMNSSTIDHDCYLDNNIVLSSNVILGGNVHVMKYANLGMKTIVHQNQVIGSFSMIGMGSIITKNKKILPGYLFYGKPVKKVKKNIFSLKKNKINDKKLKIENKKFKIILKNI
tara:strand:- start:80 stop:667 length:588 start_codon:yes stop_codon:yes gene_type:complete